MPVSASPAGSPIKPGGEFLPPTLSPVLVEALQRWSLAFEFNQEIAYRLLPDHSAQDQAKVWGEFVALLRTGAHLPITRLSSGKFGISPAVREKILQVWSTHPERQASYSEMNHELYRYYKQKWIESTQLSAETFPRKDPFNYLERLLYHQFASDLLAAFTQFESCFLHYESLASAVCCERLVAIAEQFREQFSEVQRLWLDYYRASTYHLYGQEIDRISAHPYQEAETQILTAILPKVQHLQQTSPQVIELTAFVHSQLGYIALGKGENERATFHMGQAAENFHRCDQVGEALAALNNQGLALLQQDPQKAIFHFRSLRRLMRVKAPEDRYTWALVHLNLGNAYANASLQERATRGATKRLKRMAQLTVLLFAEAVDTFERTELVYETGLALAALGRWFLLEDKHEQAIVLLTTALSKLSPKSAEHDMVKQWLALARARAEARQREVDPTQGHEGHQGAHASQGYENSVTESTTEQYLHLPDLDDSALLYLFFKSLQGQHTVITLHSLKKTNRYSLLSTFLDNPSLLEVDASVSDKYEWLGTPRFSSLSTEDSMRSFYEMGIPITSRESIGAAQEWLEFGIMQFHRGQLSRALTYLAESTQLARQEQNLVVGMMALSWTAYVWSLVPSAEEGLASATSLLVQAKHSKNSLYLTEARLRLCQTLASVNLRDHSKDIRTILVTDQPESERAGQPLLMCQHSLALGSCVLQHGERDESLAWFQQAMQETELLDDDQEMQAYLRCLALIGIAQGEQHQNHEAARRHLERALGIAEAYGNPFAMAQVRLALAESMLLEEAKIGEKAREAKAQIEVVLTQSRRREWSGMEQRATFLYSQLLLITERYEEAERASVRALEQARQLQMHEQEVIGLLQLGQAQCAQEQYQDARQSWEAASSFAQERDYEDLFHQAEALLAQLSPPQEP